MEIFEGPKIVCPQRSGLNTFAYNEIAWYGSADVYYITIKNDQINLKAILSLLNSKLYYCWFYNRGKRKGEALELFQVPLSELPMPRFPNKHTKELAKLAELAIKLAAEGDQTKLSTTEELIDDLVFDCFELTEKEKTIVLDFWNSKKSKVQDLAFDDLSD